MNEEAYHDGSSTDLWIGSDRIWHPELQMRSASIWDMTLTHIALALHLMQWPTMVSGFAGFGT